jgi:superfamily II DNA or RNA helicase
LIPAITHQTPVKERHDTLRRFREGEYKTLVTSHVLNEGVDVPDARIAIILSGTGSTREYIQRLGRVLRKGNNKHKLAILYEVIAEETSEERTSDRRKGKLDRATYTASGDRQQVIAKPKPRSRQLEIIDRSSIYKNKPKKTFKAAESKDNWLQDD